MNKPKIICISGKARHGKDTSADILQTELINRGSKVLIVHYADLVKFICKNYFGWNGDKDEAGRTLLQRVGTDVVREHSPDYWVNFVVDVISFFPNEWDYIIIPDTRFPNEVHKWKELGYDSIYLRVTRDNFVSSLTPDQLKHKSEIALDNEVPDYMIYNNGTLEDLSKQIIEICKNI